MQFIASCLLGGGEAFAGVCVCIYLIPISMMRFVSLRKDKPGFCPCARTKYFLTLFHNSNCVLTQ